MTPAPNDESETQDRRTDRIHQVVADFQRRSRAGEPITTEGVIAEHPDLMPELREELHKRQLIDRAAEEALRHEWSDAEQRMLADTLGFLDPSDSHDASTPPSRSPSPATAGSASDVPGQIGKYRVIALLDRGGQTSVFRAVDPVLQREVVIKLSLRAMPLGEATRDQLVEQGRVVAQLEHPNLDRVYELGFHGECPFLVMEYVAGLNLAQDPRREQLTSSESAKLVAQVARALAAAHERGIIHRDVKPENIVVDERGEPRLIDFGVAWLRDAWSGSHAGAGAVSGTPEYMAPEQARGEHLDERSDVFALGAVLYFLLVGRAPFAATKRAEAWRRATQCQFDASALRRPGVSRRLRGICLRAMEAEPANRYRTAAAMADDLERYLAGPRKLAKTGIALGAAAIVALGLWWRGTTPSAIPEKTGPESGVVAKVAPEGVPEHRPDILGDLRILVWQDDEPQQLAGAVPLRTGDDLRIEWRLPKGYSGTLFWFDATGKLHALAPKGSPEPGETGSLALFAWPGPDISNILDPPAGTEVIFVCASRGDPPRLEEVAAAVSEGQPWPTLPEKAVIEFDRDEVRVVGRPDPDRPNLRGPSEHDRSRPEGLVRQRAEALRRVLAGKFEGVQGVVFPHVEPSPQANESPLDSQSPDQSRP